jgi:hypothetical protein
MTLEQKTVRFFPAFAVSSLLIFVYALLLNGEHFGDGGKFSWGVSRFIDYYGPTDAGSYLRLAFDLSRLSVSAENIWILNLWPPGMSALNAIAISLPGSIFLWMILINVCLTALPVAMVLTMAKTKVGFAWLIAISTVFVFQPNKSWVLTDGLFMSDGIGSHLLLIGLLLGLRGFIGYKNGCAQSRVRKWFLLSGIAFALSLHFRVSFFPTVGVLVVLALIFLLFMVGRGTVQKKHQVLITPISLFLVSLFLTSAPWTIIVSTILHPGNPSWSTGDYQWAQRWMTEDYLLDAKAGWLVAGEANWACDIEPARCGELQDFVTSGDANHFDYLRQAAIQAAIANPLELLIVKTDPLAESTWTMAGSPITGNATSVQIIGYVVLVGLLLLSFFVSVNQRNEAWLVVLLAFSYVATLVISHVESRYMIPFWDLLLLGLMPYWVSASKTYRKMKNTFR